MRVINIPNIVHELKESLGYEIKEDYKADEFFLKIVMMMMKKKNIYF